MMAPSGSIVSSVQLVSPQERSRNPFINEFLRPVGVTNAMAGAQSLGGGRLGTISILQGTERRPFDAEDSARLARMIPHLGRVQQIQRLFNQSRERDALLGAIVDGSSTGIIALQADGPALFVNSAAQRMAETADGLALDRNGQLIVADRNVARRLAALRADVLQGGAGGIVRIARPSGRKSYVVLGPTMAVSPRSRARRASEVLLAIHDPARTTGLTEQRIGDLLQLPRGVAGVVCAVIEGEDLKHYAERANVSINTVRFHLKVAFARTGARSQAELVRTALLALNDLGSHFSDGQ